MLPVFVDWHNQVLHTLLILNLNFDLMYRYMKKTKMFMYSFGPNSMEKKMIFTKIILTTSSVILTWYLKQVVLDMKSIWVLILFDLQVEFLVRGKSSFVDLLFLHHCIFWKESVPYHIVNVIHPLNGFNRWREKLQQHA